MDLLLGSELFEALLGVLNVFWFDSDTLGVDRTEVGLFKQDDQVPFGSVVDRVDCSPVECHI